MTTQLLRDLMHAAPFRPFTVHLADGRTFAVRHPDFISLSPGGRVAVIFGEDDSMQIVDLLLVTSPGLDGGEPAHAERGS